MIAVPFISQSVYFKDSGITGAYVKIIKKKAPTHVKKYSTLRKTTPLNPHL